MTTTVPAAAYGTGAHTAGDRIETAVYTSASGLDRAAYLEFLSKAFGERWNEAAFEFYLGRSFRDRASALLVRVDGARIVAGLGVAHREVRLPSRSAPVPVAVLTAGGTLRAERRAGHYAALLECMLRRARAAGCVAALGFVTRGNGSGRGLERLGARAIPSFYITSAGGARFSPDRCKRRGSYVAAAGTRGHGVAIAAARRRRSAAEDTRRARLASKGPDRSGPIAGMNPASACFHYERDHDWLSQFVHRPNPVRPVRLSHDSIALVETVPPADRRYARARARSVERLQWIDCPKAKRTANIARLARSSRRSGREFFMYTLDPLEAAAAKRAGLEIRPGCLMVLPIVADGRELLACPWRLQSGDRL
jgi:hypothetical protein